MFMRVDAPTPVTGPASRTAALAGEHWRIDHERLETLAESVLDGVMSGDPATIDAAITSLQTRVGAHLDGEERDLLPGYAAHDPDDAARIVEEHAKIRSALALLDVAADLHLVRANALRAFLVGLRAHATRENAGLYAWAAGGTPRGDLAADLLRPEAYPLPHPGRVELRETHISRVFLTEGDAYKVKKAVRFGFLDFSTLDARRRACEAEITLNSRLAAGTYLGLVAVRIDEHGRHHLGPAGEIVDWAVHMIRLPDAYRADQRLAAGTLLPRHVDAIADAMADLHAREPANAVIAEWGAREAVTRNVLENFEQVDAAREGLLTRSQESELVDWQIEFLHEHAEAFDRRRAAGRVREGHGDLRLEHVYIGERGELTIVDCLEFSARYRCGDVCADIAFLAMDMAAHGRVDMAERLLARYAQSADDYDLYSVVNLYEGYRAYVRGKIAVLMARDTTAVLRERALADARRFFALSLSAGRRSLLTPLVIAVGGGIASGKSTIAAALADRLSAPVIDTDRTRKHLIGLPTTTHDFSGAFEGAYAQETTDRVYIEMMHRAATVLESGRPVILDASFRSAALRSSARELAMKHGVPFLFVDCSAGAATCRERLILRAIEPSVSDGRLEVFDAFLARMEPVTELRVDQRLAIDTDLPLADTMLALERQLATWPAGLTG